MNWTIAVILRVGPCPLLICSRFWGDKAARSAAGSAAGSAGRSTACLAGGSWVAGWLGARGWSEYQQVRTSADVMQHASWFFQDRNSWLHMMSWLKPGWTNMYIYIYTHIFLYSFTPAKFLVICHGHTEDLLLQSRDRPVQLDHPHGVTSV